MITQKYDIVVIGGGHAGIEASLASAKMGKKTLLITILVSEIGAASCNPAIGGLAKGHLVKEIDALGGAMAKITDMAGIQFRVLNNSKGPAVRGSRAQIDMDRYTTHARDLCLKQKNLDISQEVATKLLIEDNQIKGIVTNLKNTYLAKAVIITSGTFLNGLVHIGENKIKAGRINELSSIELAQQIKELGFEVDRLKTGTCPRVDASSIDFDKLELQPLEIPKPFSFKTDKKSFNPKQLPCYIAYTNEKTHKIIEDNFHRAPLFIGQIQGVGPRYCPSIEDKINRFKDKERHHLFVEPQTLEANEYYINGLSTSLPTDVQYEMLHSIKGFENAKITRFGYAIEYDFIQPTQLKHTLETKLIKNLFFAGQVNGTTGYEEAAAQGLISGINAALSIDQKEPFVLSRDESYIGVLIDDLVIKGTKEPYRMFTSRAEFRLLLREDNADLRLAKYGYKLGLNDKEFYEKIKKREKDINEAIEYLDNNYMTNSKENIAKLESISEQKIVEKTKLKNIVARHTFNQQKLISLVPEFSKFDEETLAQILIEAKYHHYIAKQKEQIKKMDELKEVKIPPNFDYSKLSGLSTEIVEKLQKIEPQNLFEASEISGVTPAAIDILYIFVKRLRAKS